MCASKLCPSVPGPGCCKHRRATFRSVVLAAAHVIGQQVEQRAYLLAAQLLIERAARLGVLDGHNDRRAIQRVIRGRRRARAGAAAALFGVSRRSRTIALDQSRTGRGSQGPDSRVRLVGETAGRASVFGRLAGGGSCRGHPQAAFRVGTAWAAAARPGGLRSTNTSSCATTCVRSPRARRRRV